MDRESEAHNIAHLSDFVEENSVARQFGSDRRQPFQLLADLTADLPLHPSFLFNVGLQPVVALRFAALKVCDQQQQSVCEIGVNPDSAFADGLTFRQSPTDRTAHPVQHVSELRHP